jgi:hypothetical protein
VIGNSFPPGARIYPALARLATLFCDVVQLRRRGDIAAPSPILHLYRRINN